MTGTAVDVVVVGGGIVGASAAYRLARAGVRTTLIDRVDAGFATSAGAGIISPGTTTTRPAPFYPLAFAAIGYYPTLLGLLAEDGETETGYETVGGLFIATNDEERSQLPELLRVARERRDQGVANIGEVRQISGQEARELYPALAEIPGALHLPGVARLEARTMRRALLRAAARHGMTTVAGSATLLADGDRVTAVQVNGEAIAAGAVILATGAWSADLAAPLGFALPIQPQRGQIIHLSLPGVSTRAWPVINGFYSHYQLAFPDNRVVVGATREHGSGYDYRLTAGGVHEVLSEALRVSPGLVAATIEEMRIGFRPASPDELPVLGPAPGHANLFIATGHGPSGLQLGPFSGTVVADLVLGQPAPLDLTPYAPDRFQ